MVILIAISISLKALAAILIILYINIFIPFIIFLTFSQYLVEYNSRIFKIHINLINFHLQSCYNNGNNIFDRITNQYLSLALYM